MSEDTPPTPEDSGAFIDELDRLIERALSGESIDDELDAMDPNVASDARAVIDAYRPLLGPYSRAEGAPSRGDLAGDRVGGFRVLRLIGFGGMGAVYEATQLSPERTVALKVMRRDALTPSFRRRFLYESELQGSLVHPGIAQIYEAGIHGQEEGGIPYFAMEYVQDPCNIVAFAREIPFLDRVRLFLKVCDAVHHGHQKGVIHRDIKPANVLVDANGEPKVIDFGVARLTDRSSASAAGHTQVGQLVGTLPYMSPEQCGDDPSDLDVRSDVYSLGVLLYEILTGRFPYDAISTNVCTAARVIRESAPIRPSSFDKRLRGDLETIVLTALAKDRDQRYQSAHLLGEDLNRYLAHEPITARQPGILYRLRLLARRNRTASAAVFIALLSFAWAASTVYVEQRRRSRALKARELALREAEDSAYAAEIRSARNAYREGNVRDARLHLRRARHLGGEPWELRYIESRLDLSRSTRIRFADHVHDLAFDANGSQLAVAGVGGVAIWDVQTPEQTWMFRDGQVLAVAWAQDTGLLACGSGQVARVAEQVGRTKWDVRFRLSHEDAVASLAFHPSEPLLAVGVWIPDILPPKCARRMRSPGAMEARWNAG